MADRSDQNVKTTNMIGTLVSDIITTISTIKKKEINYDIIKKIIKKKMYKSLIITKISFNFYINYPEFKILTSWSKEDKSLKINFSLTNESNQVIDEFINDFCDELNVITSETHLRKIKIFVNHITTKDTIMNLSTITRNDKKIFYVYEALLKKWKSYIPSSVIIVGV